MPTKWHVKQAEDDMIIITPPKEIEPTFPISEAHWFRPNNDTEPNELHFQKLIPSWDKNNPGAKATNKFYF